MSELNRIRKQEFIRALAKFIAGNAGAKSIMLEMESKRRADDPRPALAKEWAELVSASPVRGWVSVEEAEKQLADFFSTEAA